MLKKKTGAQLDREITEFLTRNPGDEETAIAMAEKALTRIAANYKKYERLDPDIAISKPFPGVTYPGTRDGRLRVIKDQWVQEGMFPRLIRLGIAVGGNFGWPKDAGKPGSVKERQVIVDEVTAEVKKVIERIVKAHGGRFVTVHGSSYSPMGWVAPRNP